MLDCDCGFHLQVLLTGAIVFLPAKSLVQLSFAFVVIFCFFVAHSHVKAFIEDRDDEYLW